MMFSVAAGPPAPGAGFLTGSPSGCSKRTPPGLGAVGASYIPGPPSGLVPLSLKCGSRVPRPRMNDSAGPFAEVEMISFPLLGQAKRLRMLGAYDATTHLCARGGALFP